MSAFPPKRTTDDAERSGLDLAFLRRRLAIAVVTARSLYASSVHARPQVIFRM